MGFNRITWLPGRARADAVGPRAHDLAKLRGHREKAARDRVAARALEGSLSSLARMLGTIVEDPEGRTVGRLIDVVVRWKKSETYPRLSSVVIRTGHNDLVVGGPWVTISPPNTVRLRAPAVHVRAPER